MITKKIINLIAVGIVVFLAILFAYIILRQTNRKDEVVVPDANNEINNMEAQRELAMQKASEEILETIKNIETNSVKKISDSDYIIGKTGALAEIIIYNDFNSPFFGQFNESIEKIKSEFKDNVVIAFRHFLLSADSDSMQAALASECAGEQGKFWEMYEKLSEDNQSERMNIEQFKKDALEIGLNTVDFNNCFDEEKYKEKILEQIKEGKEANVVGAPTTFINGQQFPGAYPFLDFTRENGEEVMGMKSIIEMYLSK